MRGTVEEWPGGRGGLGEGGQDRGTGSPDATSDGSHGGQDYESKTIGFKRGRLAWTGLWSSIPEAVREEEVV